MNSFDQATARHMLSTNAWVAFEAGGPQFPVVLGTSG